MNSIRTRVIGVLVGCGLMAATPFLSGALGQVIQPPSGIWCTEHAGITCTVCKDCEPDEDTPPGDPVRYVCGDVVAQQTCNPGEVAKCNLQGPPTYYTTTCESISGD